MFWKQNVKLCLIALMTCSLVAAVGCGDEPTSNDNNPVDNNPVDNNPVDNNPVDNNPVDNNPVDNNPVDNNPVDNNPPGNNPPGGIEIAPPAPKCGDDPAPERCTETDLENFDWGAASFISSLALSLDFDGLDAECCFDFNGDGKLDNGLGNVLFSFGDLLGDTDVNASIQESIDSGSLIIVLEHDGLVDVASGDAYDINFLIGSTIDTEAGEVTISAASFDGGVHPHAMLPNAKIEGTQLSAGPGSVLLSIPLLDIQLDVVLNNAMVEANVVGTNIDGGVQLSQGKLGGILPVQGIYDAINNFAATCDCLGNPAELLYEDDLGAIDCAQVTDTCDSGDICSSVAEYCTFIPVIDGFTDLDVNGDGQTDAFSLGLTFEADAIVITGVDTGEEEE